MTMLLLLLLRASCAIDVWVRQQKQLRERVWCSVVYVTVIGVSVVLYRRNDCLGAALGCTSVTMTVGLVAGVLLAGTTSGKWHVCAFRGTETETDENDQW